MTEFAKITVKAGGGGGFYEMNFKFLRLPYNGMSTIAHTDRDRTCSVSQQHSVLIRHDGFELGYAVDLILPLPSTFMLLKNT